MEGQTLAQSIGRELGDWRGSKSERNVVRGGMIDTASQERERVEALYALGVGAWKGQDEPWRYSQLL